jgi:hypothetical protein
VGEPAAAGDALLLLLLLLFELLQPAKTTAAIAIAPMNRKPPRDHAMFASL